MIMENAERADSQRTQGEINSYNPENNSRLLLKITAEGIKKIWNMDLFFMVCNKDIKVN